MSFEPGRSRDASARNRAQRDAARHSLSEPRRVTRGETTHTEQEGNTAIVDWLGFTVWPPGDKDILWLAEALESTFNIPQHNWQKTNRGWMGYEHRIDLSGLGLVAYGGEMQRGSIHVELNAHTCGHIQDWNAVRLWGETYDAKITRVDLAHDDHEGAQLDIETALQWFRDGKFNANGRPPVAELIDDLGSNKGKTLYLGQRASGKLLRVYEKGKQLGDPRSAWVRAEVELRAKGRHIPWNVVTSPARYLAGAYPALAFLSQEQDRLRTVQRTTEISYVTMVRNLRTQGGKSLNVMHRVHEGDAEVVLTQLIRDGVPKRLAGYRDLMVPRKESGNDD